MTDLTHRKGMKVRRAASWIGAAFLAGVLLASPMAASAGTAAGNYATVTASGVTHSHRAVVVTTADYGRSYVSISAPVSRPTGYMGAKARTYRNGSLWVETVYIYNNAPTTSWSVWTGYQYYTGTYYGGGYGAAWSTSGSYYVTGTTPISPSQNVPG